MLGSSESLNAGILKCIVFKNKRKIHREINMLTTFLLELDLLPDELNRSH